MNISLGGKVAIITGGFSGIGFAVAGEYLASGAAGVVLVDRSEICANVEALAEKFGGKLITVRGDVTSDATAAEYTKAALDAFGRIDVLVSNAAISVVKPVHEHTPEEFDAVMTVNVKGLYLAARHVIPVMIAQNSGLILVTGSISGEAGIPSQGAYAPSKGALHQMVRQMAIEYAKHNIRVNAVACGTVDTPLVHQSAELFGDKEAFWKMLRGAHPIGRIATAQEVAAFYTFLASDMATFFTGAILMLDGGYTAQ